MAVTRKRTAEMAAMESGFDATKAKQFFAKAKANWAAHHDGETWVAQAHLGLAEMHINETTLGQILNGKIQALLWHCLIIARELEVSLEDVLRVEGLPDVQALLDMVEKREAANGRDAQVKQYILDTLRFAQHNRDWQRLTWESTYKERAEMALVLNVDPLTRARFYADAVYEWWQHRNDDLPRYRRKTTEMLAMS
jgi:DNA-binding XRE family transcriptional regulator